MAKQELSFQYDGLFLVRLFLQKHVEQNFDNEDNEIDEEDENVKAVEVIKAVRFAHYEYLKQLTDEELEGFLLRYMKESQMDAITLTDWQKDCATVWSYIYETEKYKLLEFDYKKKGYGVTGLGVVDNSDNTFYDCGFTGHWPKVQEIIQEKYPHYYEPLMQMSYGSARDEYNGVTREEVDAFVLNTFTFTGGNKELGSYLE